MLWWLAQNTLVAGLLAGLVALLCRLGRLGPAARHALWLVVLVKLVTPPVIEWPWALPGIGQARPTERLAAADAATAEEDWFLSQVELQTIVRTDEAAPGEEPPLLPQHIADRALELSTANQAQSAAWLHAAWLASVVYNLWLAGTAIICLLQVFRIARFRRLLARADPAPRWLEDLVAKVAGTLRVRRPLTLIVPEVGSPFVWSLGRPKLLWPASLLERLPHHCQRSIVAHELAHLRRRDHWVGWLQLVAECVWWWNPLFWYVRRQLRLNAELACDAWVVSTLPEDRRAYAEALIEVTQLISQTAAPVPALGMSSVARQDFERRLTMIVRDRVPCRVPVVGLLAIGMLALISLPGWSQVQVQVRKVQDLKETPAPEKPIILNRTGDLGSQDALHVVQDVQKSDGVKRVWLVADQPAAAPDRERRLQKLEEQLQELLKEVQALRAGGPKPQVIFKVLPDTKPGELSDRAVQIIKGKHSEVKHGGRVTRTDPQTGYVTVNVGSDAGLSKGNTLEVYRLKPAPTYLGTIQILDVRPNEAVGRPIGSLSGEIQVGDQVASSIKGRGTVTSAVFSPDGKIVRELTLTRATYKLPHAKAEALANFLTQHAKVDVLETKVEGDSLIVTTTSEAQSAIRHFISLIQGAGAVLGVTFSPDGKTILTESADGTWRVWDAATGKDLQRRTEVLELPQAKPDAKK